MNPTPRTNGRLKVCLATMAPFLAGAEVAAERLAFGLREEGHEVLLLVGQDGEARERYEQVGLNPRVSPMYLTDKWHLWRYWRARRALRRLLQRERPDVIHSNDLPTHQMVSDAARGLGIPRVCHHRFPFPGLAIDWMLKFGAEHHLFIAQALMDEMTAESARLRASSRAVVFDGLPLPSIPSAEVRRRAREALGLPLDRLMVIIAGQVIERKGVADLIEAWALLPAECRARAELVIAGDDLLGHGEYRRAMEQLAAERGVPARFVGFQKNIGQWLTASDVATVPSHVEPMANANLEAMSYGLPLVSSRVGGIPEAVLDGETGLLVPPKSPAALAEALARLLTDEPLRLRLGQQGRRRCEEVFSLLAHTRGVVGQYRSVLERSCAC